MQIGAGELNHITTNAKARFKPKGNLFKTTAVGTTLGEQWSTIRTTRVHTSTSKCFGEYRSMPLITLNLSHSNDILNNVHLEKHTQVSMAKIHMNGHPTATEVSITLLKTKHMTTFYLQISKASLQIINPPISPNNAIKTAEHACIPVMSHDLHKHHFEACNDHVLPTIHTPSPSIFPNSSPSSHPTISTSSLLSVLL